MSDSTAYSLMSLQQDIPEEVPRWDYSEDVLGNFEHFADTATGAQAFEGPEAVTAAGLLAEEPAGPSNLQPDPGGPSARVAGQRSGAAETRKQAQNRQAQQRFRQRQRVRICAQGLSGTDLLILGTCPGDRTCALQSSSQLSQAHLQPVSALAGQSRNVGGTTGGHNGSGAAVASQPKTA